jgi:hypothetical protein
MRRTFLIIFGRGGICEVVTSGGVAVRFGVLAGESWAEEVSDAENCFTVAIHREITSLLY